MLDLRRVGSLGLNGDAGRLRDLMSQLGAIEDDDASFSLGGRSFSSTTAELAEQYFEGGVGETLFEAQASSSEYFHSLRVNGRKFDIFSFDASGTVSSYSEMSMLLAKVCKAADLPEGPRTWVLGPEATPDDLWVINRLGYTLGATSDPVRHLIEDIEVRLERPETRFRINCLLGANSVGLPKYRFLELYRIVEAQFLIDLKAYFDANFMRAPGETADKLLRAVGSEREKLMEVSQKDNVKAEFHFFYELVDDLAARGNTLSVALMKKLKEERKGAGQNPVQHWRLGASLIYALRCAIVHAGQMDIRYDHFPDGDAVVSETLDTMQNIGFALLRA